MLTNEPQGDGPGAVEQVHVGATPEPGVAADDGRYLLEPWSDLEEVEAVPEILEPGEEIMAVGSGTVLRSGRLAKPRWLVVLSDRRVLCIKGRAAEARKVIDMPISAIKSVSRTGLFQKALVLNTGFGTLRVTGMKREAADNLVASLTAFTEAFRARAAEGVEG